MTASNLEVLVPKVRSVMVSSTAVTFSLEDGRTVSAPLDWFPRLLNATAEELRNWHPIGAGYGAHWPDLDEDISVENLLAGRRSLELERSFQRWVSERHKDRAQAASVSTASEVSTD